MKMRNLFVLLLASSLAISTNAQTITGGDKVVNFGIGLGSTLYSGVGYKAGLPPLSVSFEYALQELGPGMVGVGGYLGLSTYKWEYTYGLDTYGYKYSNIVIGARGYYHYSFLDKLDTYAGLMLGYDIVSGKETGTLPLGVTYSANSSSFIWSFFVGGRYYFTDSFAAMAELGYGIAWLNLGIAYKF